MRRRVVITGMGAVTPVGHSVAELYENQLHGQSGVGPITLFDASKFPTTFAGQVKDFDLSRWVPEARRYENCGVNTVFALAAAKQALADAGILHPSSIDRTRCGLYLGSGEGIQDFHHLVSMVALSYRPSDNKIDTAVFTREGLKLLNPGREYEQELHTTPGHVAE